MARLDRARVLTHNVQEEGAWRRYTATAREAPYSANASATFSRW